MDVQEYISAFKDGNIQVSDNISYSQREIIEANNLGRNSKFKNEYFADGETRKTKYNISQGFCFSLLRSSLISQKQLVMVNESGKNQKLVDVVKFAVRHHLGLNGFTDRVEEVTQELIEMGHIIGKVLDGESKLVNLQNIVFRPDVPIKDGGCVERQYLTYDDALAQYGKEKFISKIKKHYKELSDDDKPFIYFIEYWTIDEFVNEKGEKEMTKGCIRYLDNSRSKPEDSKDASNWQPYVELERFVSPHFKKSRNLTERKRYGEKYRVYPYVERKFINIPGRSLGAGVYEIARYLQEDYDEKGNFKRKFDKFSLRGILVHKIGHLRRQENGEALTQEFLRNMDTGSVLKIFNDESIDRLNMGNTTTETVAMMNFLFEVIRFMLGITPQSIGQSSSNRTASFAIIQNQTQQSTYGIIKKKIGGFFEEILQDYLAEDIIENITYRDFIAYSGDPSEIQELDRYLAQQAVYKAVKEKGVITDEATVQKVIDKKVEDMRANGSSRSIDISNSNVKKTMKALIKDLDYIIKFHFTDEALDVATKIRTMLDADKVQNPRIKASILDLAGIPAREMEMSQNEKDSLMEEEMKKQQAIQQAKDGGFMNDMAQVPEVTATNGVQQ